MANEILSTGHALYSNVIRGLSADPRKQTILDSIPSGTDDLARQTNVACKTIEVAATVTPSQGIATDGSYWYEFNTSTIVKSVFATGVVDTTNAAPFTSLPSGVDHIGDGTVSGGFVYAPIVDWNTVAQTSVDQTIGVYDATDLTYDSQIDISGSTDCNASGLCIGHTGNFFVTSFTTATTPDDRLVDIYEFNSSGTQIAVHTLDEDIIGMQGIEYDSDNSVYFITSYEPGNTNNESIIVVDTSFNVIYRANPTGMNDNEIEGICLYNNKVYSHEGSRGIREVLLDGMYITTATGNPLLFLANADIPDSGSIVIRGTPGSLFNYNSVWDNDNTANDWESWIYSDGRLAARINASNNAVSASSTASAEEEQIFGFSWEKSGSTVTYDCVHNGTIEATQSGATWVTAPAAGLFLGGKNSSNSVGDFHYKDVVVYDKRLDSTEWADLNTDFDAIYTASEGGGNSWYYYAQQ